MRNSKRIKELEQMIGKLALKSVSSEELAKCKNCKCIGYETDFKKVIVQCESSHYLWSGHYNDGESSEFYCQKCAPKYDFVDKRNQQIHYFVTVEEHRKEVKIQHD